MSLRPPPHAAELMCIKSSLARKLQPLGTVDKLSDHVELTVYPRACIAAEHDALSVITVPAGHAASPRLSMMTLEGGGAEGGGDGIASPQTQTCPVWHNTVLVVEGFRYSAELEELMWSQQPLGWASKLVVCITADCADSPRVLAAALQSLTEVMRL